MEADLQSLLGSISRDVHSCTHWLRRETPQLPPPPALGLVYEGAIGQQRQTTSLCNPLILTFATDMLAGYSSPIC